MKPIDLLVDVPGALGDMVRRKTRGACPFCGENVGLFAFRDAASEKEFRISGLCQTCQDKTFGVNAE